MPIRHNEDVPQQAVTMPGAKGCTVRWLVGEAQGAPNFAMRQFEVQPGGFTPHHSHPYEHEVFILAGQGEMLEGSQTLALKPGDVVFVKPDETHQFRNTGQSPLKFLCLVPNSSQHLPVKLAPECGQEPNPARPT